MRNKPIKAERMKNVFLALRGMGTTQKDIAAATGTDEIFLSQLKSGKIKSVVQDFIDILEEKYYINPYYLNGESKIMMSPHIEQLKYFDKAVEKWDTVKSSEQEYLHLSMDKLFYDFLLEVNKARLAVADGISSESAEIRNLAKLYEGEKDIQEFVLLPRNNFIEILSAAKEDRTKLEEVIDMWKHLDYLETDSDS